MSNGNGGSACVLPRRTAKPSNFHILWWLWMVPIWHFWWTYDVSNWRHWKTLDMDPVLLKDLHLSVKPSVCDLISTSFFPLISVFQHIATRLFWRKMQTLPFKKVTLVPSWNSFWNNFPATFGACFTQIYHLSKEKKEEFSLGGIKRKGCISQAENNHLDGFSLVNYDGCQKDCWKSQRRGQENSQGKSSNYDDTNNPNRRDLSEITFLPPFKSDSSPSEWRHLSVDLGKAVDCSTSCFPRMDLETNPTRRITFTVPCRTDLWRLRLIAVSNLWSQFWSWSCWCLLNQSYPQNPNKTGNFLTPDNLSRFTFGDLFDNKFVPVFRVSKRVRACMSNCVLSWFCCFLCGP